jgi:hypothetical protein
VHQIRFAYFHVRHILKDGRLRYRYPEAARRLIAVMHGEAPDVKAIAWIFAGNERLKHTGVGEVDLAKTAVRRKMVAETRAALPPGKLLSVATPIRSPLPGRLGWSDATFTRVARVCDQIAVMGYDTGMILPRAYVWTVRQQAIHVPRAVARGTPRCRVMIGVPTYGQGPPSHFPWSENILMALKGVREGLSHPDAAREAFAGVAPFADYTTQPEEWATYRALWLGGSR